MRHRKTMGIAVLASWLGLAGAPAPGAAGTAVAIPEPAPSADYETGLIPEPHILMPKDDVSAIVYLLSDAGGWSGEEAALAGHFRDGGAIVVGIDLPRYLASLETDVEDDGCVYTLSSIEDLSQQAQRVAGNATYHMPIIAGIGAGGALALGIAAQTPPSTVGATVAVDPDAGIGLVKELCTPAARRTSGGKTVYGLSEGELPDPVAVLLTAAAPADGRAHVAALTAEHADIVVTQSDKAATAALSDAVDALIAGDLDTGDDLGLPLSVLDARPTRGTMAVIYSGDGGWRDLDRDIGGSFQAQGVPTIGVDSLHYFWSKRTAQETAADLSRIIDLYRRRWKVDHVLLVGYSFGADVLPSTFNRLSAADKALVPMLSLLGLSETADFQISVMGWLGVDASGDDDNLLQLKSIDPARVQCVYGTEDDESVCAKLKGTGAELVAIEGGHHFDGDYDALAAKILASLDRRLGRPPAAAATK